MQKYQNEVDFENKSNEEARNASLDPEAAEAVHNKKNIDKIYSNLNSRKTPT